VGRSDVAHKAPPPPIALQVLSASRTSLTLTWSARDLGDPAHAFELLRDGTTVATTAETSFTFVGLSCNTAYELGVRAFDAAGNHSGVASVIAAPDACAEPATRPRPPMAEPPVPVRSDSSVPPEPSQPVPSIPDSPAAPASPAVPKREFRRVLPESDATTTEVAWAGAGAFVWHETDVAPEVLGAQLRENGFTWVAVLIHDGLAVDPVEEEWVRRFRAASQLLVGGWGVLRTEPEREADLAHRLLEEYSLDFYIANPESEYKFSGDDGQSAERYGRSQRFVDSFRALEHDMPAAISSYCRADTQDIDWGAWNSSGFVFLPQAYVNDFGRAASPTACVEGAAEFFPANAVHPTVGVYTGQEGAPSPEDYAALLDEAGTVGFSVYLAETRMQADEWRLFGAAIDEQAIARLTAAESDERAARQIQTDGSTTPDETEPASEQPAR
jgi:hypothetical protein